MIGFLTSLVGRPVLSLVMSLVLLLLGLQAFFSLTVRAFPETTFSSITITTPYPGADADLVKGFITTPLERIIASANGIEYLTSTSVQGISSISARLEQNYDPQTAVAEILAKVNQISNTLPPAAENSAVAISSGDGGSAIYLSFKSDVLTRAEIADYVQRSVEPRLATVAGVQESTLAGPVRIALRVGLDPNRMAALGVTPSDVRGALSRNNTISAVGDTDGATRSLSLGVDTNVASIEDFEDLVIRRGRGQLIRLSDVGDVAFGSESYDTSVVINGEPGINLGVNAAPEANLLDVVAGVRDVFPAILDSLPPEIEASILYDTSLAVQRSISGAVQSLLLALAIVTIVIYLFLGSLRSALIPAITMPLAIVGAFFVMQALGFSINLLTLLALVLAIGTIVDDSIIVTENSVRHVASGMEPAAAAEKTVSELGRSVIAMNIVVLAAFLPVGFAGGLTGALFREFAYVVVAATLCSGLVALTLSPMMCRYILRADDGDKKGPARWLDKGFGKLRSGYMAALDTAFRWNKIVLVIALVIVGSVYFLYTGAQSELAPNEDQGYMEILLSGDPNASLDQTEAWTDVLTDGLSRFEEIESWFSIRGSGALGTGARVGIVLKDWDTRERTVRDLNRGLSDLSSAVAGFDSIVIVPDTLPGAVGGAQIQFVISSTEDPRNIYEIAETVVRDARDSGLFSYFSSDLKFDRRKVNLNIDRDRAAALDIDMAQLSADISTMTSEGDVNFFSFDGSSYRVIPQATRESLLNPRDIGRIYVRSGSGALVPLSGLVDITETAEPRQLSRFNQLNAAVIQAVSAPDVSYGDAIRFLQDQALPSSYVPDWTGQARQFLSEGSTLLLTFGLAVAIIYLTLSAQYESFRDPAVMFICVPMALAGALVFFYFGVVTVNIYTQIGLLALIAVIIRHGILLVEFANAIQRDTGASRQDAMREAAEMRFRSILMTTISTVTGMLPLIFASDGPGAQSRFAIAFTLVAGMTVGTIFTLFVVPALYPLIAKTRSETDKVSRAKEDPDVAPDGNS